MAAGTSTSSTSAHAHARKLSSGSNAAGGDTSTNLLSSSTSSSSAGAAGAAGATAAAGNTSTASTSSNNSGNNLHKRNTKKSSTPSAINTAAANALLNASTSSSASTSSNGNNGLAAAAAAGGGAAAAQATTPTSSTTTSSKQHQPTTSSTTLSQQQALSGLLSPDSASNLSAAQQSALAKALAAGISREDFEKTRASVVSMLRGRTGSASSGSAVPASSSGAELRRSVTPIPFPTSSANSADTSLVAIDELNDDNDEEEEEEKVEVEAAIEAIATSKSHETLPRLAIGHGANSSGISGNQPKSNLASSKQASRSSLANSMASSSSSSQTRTHHHRNGNAGLDSASTSQTNLSSIFSEPVSNAPSASTSTFRTSVSSSATDDVFSQHAQDSPLTSEDGHHHHRQNSRLHPKEEAEGAAEEEDEEADADVDAGEQAEDKDELASPVTQDGATSSGTGKVTGSPRSRTSSGGGKQPPRTLSTSAKATAARLRRKLQKEKAAKEAEDAQAQSQPLASTQAQAHDDEGEGEDEQRRRQVTPTMQIDTGASGGRIKGGKAKRTPRSQQRQQQQQQQQGQSQTEEDDRYDLDLDDTPLSAISMDRSHASVGPDEEDDSSFSAATAAAAALGMLASSPVKIVERRHSHRGVTGGQLTHDSSINMSVATVAAAGPSSSSLSNGPMVPFMNGASGMFSQHRQPSFVSSSSPPTRGGGGGGLAIGFDGGHGAPSSSSSRTLVGGGGMYSTSPPARGSRSPLPHSYHDHNDHFNVSPRHRSRASAGRSASGSSGAAADAGSRKQHSTTPVRTRLEDIALKSSAQIRRQRELLGLGEEEMMDMDTDARHENVLLRDGSVFLPEEEEELLVLEDDEEVPSRPGRKVEDVEEEFLDYVDEDEQEESDSRHVARHLLRDDDAAHHGRQVYSRGSSSSGGGRRAGHGEGRTNSLRRGRGMSHSKYEREDLDLRGPEEDLDEPDDIDVDLDKSGGSSSGGLAPAFSYPRTSSPAGLVSAAHDSRRLTSRSPSRPVPSSEPRPSSHHQHHHSRHSSRHTSQSQQHLFTPGRGGSTRHGEPSSSHYQSPASSSRHQPQPHHQHHLSPRGSATSPRRRGHHRRVSSYGMSGIMDRFMESSYSPKAAQIAKFEEAVRRASPERGSALRPSSSSSAYDTDRTLIQGRKMHVEDLDAQFEGEVEDEYYLEREEQDYEDLAPASSKSGRHQSVTQSTPKSHAEKSRTARSPRYHSGLPSQERETPRLAKSGSGYKSRQELGLSSGHGSSSEFGSARKRKASYDLQSPRQLVRPLQASPTPEEDEEDLHGSGPLSPSSYPHSEQKFYSRTAAGHPSSNGLFDGPTPSHSQSSSQSSAASYRLTQSQPRSQRPRQGPPAQLVYQSHPSHVQHPYSQPGPSHHHRMPHGLAERAPPGYYQQFPRRADGAEELSMYALAPPRPPSQNFIHAPHSQQMSRPHSLSSEYALQQQRDFKPSKDQSSAKKPNNRERVDSVPSSTASVPMTGPSSSSAVSTLDNFVPADIQVGQYDENSKPPFSYAALIGQAIFSTPNRRMSLADIYTYIMTLYPFYKKQDAGWQNSIRHNLSLNECFVKTQRGPDEPGKGCLWSISPGSEEQFTGGNFYKKGKVPRSASKSIGGGTSTAPSSNDGHIPRQKANSVASGTETMSAVSAEDSYETQSMNSSSFISNGSGMVQQQAYAHHQQPVHASYGHHGYAVQGHPGVHYQHPSQPHGPSSLRQSKPRPRQSDEFDSEVPYDEEDDSFDMDNPPARYARPMPVELVHGQKLLVRQAREAVEQRGTAIVPKRESSPEGEDFSVAKAKSSRELRGELADAERSFSNSDGSGSAELPMRHLPPPPTSPTRRGLSGAEDRHRPLLTSPPIMSSPPTNVFARMSQPYQPLRNSFNIPATNAHAEALMSSPPPSSGIMPSDVRMRRLPPPTPRSAAVDEETHAGSHIFLPAPNIKPGKSSSGKKDGSGDDAKPTLPPIHMMSPASAMTLNTQSPVSSVRGSATQQRSSSPSPKSSSQASTSGTSLTRSPTLSKSRHLSSSEVFKTPERFAAPSSRSIASPSKLAHLANNNASKALQSLQSSTPKLGASRGGHGLVTPGGYYDPYEYGAVLDEELDRMMATSKEGDSVNRHGDRRPLPFPSPLDRTPKWQPWSPW